MNNTNMDSIIKMVTGQRASTIAISPNNALSITNNNKNDNSGTIQTTTSTSNDSKGGTNTHIASAV